MSSVIRTLQIKKKEFFNAREEEAAAAVVRNGGARPSESALSRTVNTSANHERFAAEALTAFSGLEAARSLMTARDTAPVTFRLMIHEPDELPKQIISVGTSSQLRFRPFFWPDLSLYLWPCRSPKVPFSGGLATI